MPDRKRVKSIRKKLWLRQRHRCYWCKCVTIYVSKRWEKHEVMPANLATLDHMDSRLSPFRGQFNGWQRLVMACHACNQRRSNEEIAALGIEEQRRRSGRYPAALQGAAAASQGSTLAERVKAAQDEMASWTQERRDGVRLEGPALSPDVVIPHKEAP